jgi:membrane protein required for colicin V production
MNYIDIIILIFLLWGAVRGFFKGLIIEVTTLIGLVVGAYFAIEYTSCTEGLLRDFFNFSSRYVPHIAMAINFILAVLAFLIIGRLLTKFANFIFLGLINKLLGSVFGILKYMILVFILLLMIDKLNENFHFLTEETRKERQLYQPFLNFAREIYNGIRH